MSRKITIEVKPPRDPAELERRALERAERRSKVVSKKRARTHDHLADMQLNRWETAVPRRSLSHGFGEVSKTKWNGQLSRTQSKVLSEWVETPSGFVILAGGEGVGKTTLAVAMVSQVLLDQGEHINHSPIFAPYNDMLMKISFAGSELNSLVAGLSETNILVIDDMGAGNEGISPHQKKALWSIIDSRWSNRLPTIITTNMSLAGNEDGLGMQDLLGPSAWARMIDELEVIEMDGDSFRSKV